MSMEYRRLGRSGLVVSQLCLGTLLFGGRTDEPTAERIVGIARDKGINFVDTADRYSLGASEAMVGRLLKRDRHDWVVVTKVASAGDDDKTLKINKFGLSRKWMLEELENSLRKLQTDYIDVWYLHLEDHGSFKLGPPAHNVEATYRGEHPEGGPWFDRFSDDPGTPLEETVLAVGDAIRSGKVRYFGVSNYKGWRIALICALCDRYGIPRPIVSQPFYNAMNRMAEVEHLPACHHLGLGVVPYSVMARGVLTAKYTEGQPPPENSRIGVKNFRIIQSEYRSESLRHAKVIKEYAEKRGLSPGALAVAWALNNRYITSVLTGARIVEQMDDYFIGANYVFTAEDEAFFDSLVAAGHPSTHGFTDPMTPVEGRVTRLASERSKVL